MKRLNAFLANVRRYEHKDVYLMDCMELLIRQRKLVMVGGKGELHYADVDVQDVIDLLQNLIALLVRYEHYNIAFVDRRQNRLEMWNGYCLMVKERRAVVLSPSEGPGRSPHGPAETGAYPPGLPHMRSVIQEPMVVAAFEEYCAELWAQIAPEMREKERTIRWLQSRIDMLVKEEE
jgi:hypothetical protein